MLHKTAILTWPVTGCLHEEINANELTKVQTQILAHCQVVFVFSVIPSRCCYTEELTNQGGAYDAFDLTTGVCLSVCNIICSFILMYTFCHHPHHLNCILICWYFICALMIKCNIILCHSLSFATSSGCVFYFQTNNQLIKHGALLLLKRHWLAGTRTWWFNMKWWNTLWKSYEWMSFLWIYLIWLAYKISSFCIGSIFARVYFAGT